MKSRCVVIGSGLGGLATAAVLAREGYEVTVVEQSHRVGGCLQCFSREGSRFETGMHFVGSLDEGQVLRHYLNYLGIWERLKFDRLDTQGYDVVGLRGERFAFANGHGPMVEALATRFPHEREGLRRFWQLADSVAQSSPYYRLPDAHGEARTKGGDFPSFRLFSTSVDEVLESVIGDELLREVLMGNISLYAARRGVTPFSTCAFIANFYNNSAFRVVGGSETIADALVEVMVGAGGTVRTNSRVLKVRCSEGRAQGVVLEDGTCLPADLVVSDVHPSQLKDWFDEHELRPVYHSRIGTMANTTSAFSLFLKFKPQSMPYMNHNYYGFACPSPWDMASYTEADWPRGYLYMHHCHQLHPQWADSGVVLAYMSVDELAEWRDTLTGRRGSSYEDFKRRKAMRLLAAVEKDFPGIGSQIASYYTATPLTYRDYTLTPEGSMYGLERDVKRGLAGRVDYRTKIPNVLLVGQNINAHGMLGVLVGVLKVCGHILGDEAVTRQMVAANAVPQPPRPTTVVMGGGLGGLLVGALLTKKGHRVTVLERHREVGGGLCSFARGGVSFATGMHVFGGFQKGGLMERLCSYLGLSDKLDLLLSEDDCVDEVMVTPDGVPYRIPRGREAFVAYFSRRYPHEADGIRRYVDALYRLAQEEDLFYLRDDEHTPLSHSEEFLWPVGRFIEHYITDADLRAALSYLAPLYGGVIDETPAYVHALVNILHIEGTAQFAGHSSQMAEVLARMICDSGGTIRVNEAVTGFTVEDHRIVQVFTSAGGSYQADNYVSDLPIHTLLALSPPNAFPRSFHQRLEDAADSYSAFKVYVRFKPMTQPHRPSPLYYAADKSAVWDCVAASEETWPRCAMVLTQAFPQEPAFAQTMTVICPMAYERVAPWEGTSVGHRGEDYQRWKQECTDRVLDLLEMLMPGLRSHIEGVEASSPLTIRDYLGNRRCGMYGLHKDCNNMMQSQLSVRTKVRNLFLTGQNVNLHGMCGVAVTAIATAETLLGDSSLRREVREAKEVRAKN